MKKILILAAAAALSAACSLDSDYRYKAPKDSVYFNYLDTTKHNLVFSFAYDLSESEHTIYLPVKISGERTNVERRFKVVVNGAGTSAEANLHYRPLESTYAIPAGEGTFELPVVLYNNDPELFDKTVKLTLNLVASDDFDVAFPYLTIAVVSFSCRLEEPAWWRYWTGNIGNYARAKHLLFNAATDNGRLYKQTPDEGEEWDYGAIPRSLLNISLYKSLLSDPLRWVEKNPDYVMTLQPDGNYLFHHVDAPGITVLYRSADKYFVDENGLTIIAT